jgi:hypothetical protein
MNVFREAKIILPARADADALAVFEARLVTAFGGFTRHAGHGAWRNPGGAIEYEDILTYVVAVPAFMAGAVEDENRAWHGAAAELRAIAREACNRLGQTCVYLRLPTGDVHLINPHGRDFNPDTAPAVYPRASEFWRARNAGTL